MFYDSYVIAPQCPYRETEDGEDKPKTDDNVEYTKWVNRDWRSGSYNLSETPETKALATVANLVKTYAARPEIDASRVYVIGLSMGGYGTWDIIARHGEIFAAAVPMCGGGPLDMAEALSDMPIYAFHATNDSAVPYGTGTKAMYDAISAYGKNNMMLVTMGNDGHADYGIKYGKRELPNLHTRQRTTRTARASSIGCSRNTKPDRIAT